MSVRNPPIWHITESESPYLCITVLPFFEVLEILLNIVGILWFGVLGTALGQLVIGGAPLACPVVDANGETTPGQGYQDDASVLYVGPLLSV